MKLVRISTQRKEKETLLIPTVTVNVTLSCTVHVSPYHLCEAGVR